MAYGVLYEYRRTSTNGADILITISQRDYEGEVKQRSLGRAPVIKRENNGHIYGTSCELYAECLVDGEFSQLYTSDAYEFSVAVYRNDSLLWMGFVSPELYSEPDVAPPYDVQIIATDGLGELKNFKFEKRGIASMLSHINYLMGKTGIGMALNIVSELRYVDDAGVASADKGVLDFKINLDHEEGSTCYDVLQNLLSSINANITQYNGRYLIFRETDFINKATEEGVEGFDINGSAVALPVASFGSMNQHKWWPVGQLSTVIEPAKNEVVLRAPDHYKDNVLDFDDWALANAASFNEEEGAYILPDEGSNISQYVDFDGVEVGYRLGLRVRARNVGSSEDEQNIGIKVEIEKRSYSAGDRYWLVKSSGTSSGRQLTDYMWRNVDDYIEEELPLPSDADTDSDAQDIDIVLPLYRNGSRSYVYAKNVKLTIFNPAGIHDIYVYDVSLVKYEQIEGYEADVVINNAAREEEGEVELTMSDGDLAPAAGEVFMTGIPLLPLGSDPIKQWQVGDGNPQDYLSVMAYDYSRAIALPKMKYAGVLNVPGTTVSVPLLFLRDGTYYFPKTYSYDIYNDELEVELISISAADVSLTSVIISQMAQSSGNMGGLTTSGSGGGGVVSLPRDKEMSDTSDNAVENKVIKAYVDGEVKDVADLLTSMWYFDSDGNLCTDHDVIIKANLIVEKDTSSGGEGKDTPAQGTVTGIEVNGTPYEPNTQGVIDLSAAFNAIDVSDQLKDYYTKTQTDSAISTAIAELVNGAPTTLDTLKEIADALAENEDVVEALESAIGTKADKTINITAGTGLSGGGTLASNVTLSLATSGVTAGTYPKVTVDKYGRVTAGATLVAGDIPALGISKITGLQTELDNRYTETEVDTLLKKYLLLEAASQTITGDITINGNLIVTGDTSSGGEGSDTPASGTVTGIKVNGVTYEPTAGIVTIPDYPTSLTWEKISGRPTKLSQFTDDVVSGKYLSLAGGILTGKVTALSRISMRGTILEMTKNDGTGGIMLWNGESSGDGVRNLLIYDGTAWRKALHSGNIGDYNAGGLVEEVVTDLNSASSNRVFTMTSGYNSSAGNKPNTGWITGITLRVAQNDTYQVQIAASEDNKMYFRRENAGIWGTWKTIAFTDSDITGNAATASLASKAVQLCTNPSGLTYAYASETGSFITLGRNNYAAYLDGSSVTLRYGSSLAQGLLLNSSGNVGIGTTSPAYKLDVAGNVGIGTTSVCNLILRREGVNYITAANALYLTTSGSITALALFADGTAQFSKAVTMSSTLSVGGNTTINGNTLATNYALYDGASNPRLHLTDGSKHHYVQLYQTKMGVGPGSGLGLYILTSGYTGINTNDPNHTLDVNGTGRFTGAVTMSSTLAVTGNITCSANIIASGDTSSGSDIRFKDRIEDMAISISDIANAPLFTFKWNDREDDTIHLGSSAQYWEKVCPWLVTGEDFKSLNYATLGVAMGISLAKKAVNHEERIKALEKENNELREKIRRIEYGC